MALKASESHVAELQEEVRRRFGNQQPCHTIPVAMLFANALIKPYLAS